MTLKYASSLFLAALLPVLCAVPAAAEPFLSRDAVTATPGFISARVDGWWGASRGAFGSDREEISLSATPGTAFVRGAGLEVRMGLPGSLEVSAAGGYSVQEIKVDRWDSTSGWNGSEVMHGEGADDIGLSIKWAPLRSAKSAFALEAGVCVPVARGPDRATSFYGRMGSGSWSFPLGMRISSYGGPVTAYGAAFWEPSIARPVRKWDGVGFGGSRGFRAGQASWFCGGAEISTGVLSWGIELSWHIQGGDSGGAVEALRSAGRGGEVWPVMESVEAVPSVRLEAGKGSDLLIAAFIPLDGRGIYRVFSASLAWRKSF